MAFDNGLKGRSRRLFGVSAALILLALSPAAAAPAASASSDVFAAGLAPALTLLRDLGAGFGALMVVFALVLRAAEHRRDLTEATKSIGVVAIVTLIFSAIGRRLMTSVAPGALLGSIFPQPSALDLPDAPAPYADIFRGAMFAALAAIAALAPLSGRAKPMPQLIYAALFAGLVSPIVGGWVSGGYLAADWGFRDFAGATVFAVAPGAAGLAGALVLSFGAARTSPAKAAASPATEASSAGVATFLAFGGFLLMLSVAAGAVEAGADLTTITRIVFNLMITAAAAIAAALAMTHFVYGRTDIGAAANATLGAAAALAAAPDAPAGWQAAIVGVVCGAIVTTAGPAFARLRMKDPTGIAPALYCCGGFGLLIASWYRDETNLGGQIVGLAMVTAFAFLMSALLFAALRYSLGLAPDRRASGGDRPPSASA